jgi:photosystem II stability/assembly factor-like uncharacterized protein
VTRLYLATGDALVLVTQTPRGWTGEVQLPGLPTQCVAVDPLRPGHVVCGTFGRGVWISTDAGSSWRPAGDEAVPPHVTAVAVGWSGRGDPWGVLWAGTEPSALLRSEDGGRTWKRCRALEDLPSARTWSFPPRPWTHHVRWIAPDPAHAGRLFVAIELGGVMRSLDGGETWEDHKPGALRDAHTLAVHPDAPGRVYEAAGGGYAESRTGGDTWEIFTEGLRHRYLWGLAVDPGDPDTVVVSAAAGPGDAHDPQRACSTLYRRQGGPFQEVRQGLPRSEGTRVMTLVSHRAEPGVVYAASQEGSLFRSADGGAHWERLPLSGLGSYRWREVRGAATGPWEA